MCIIVETVDWPSIFFLTLKGWVYQTSFYKLLNAPLFIFAWLGIKICNFAVFGLSLGVLISVIFSNYLNHFRIRFREPTSAGGSWGSSVVTLECPEPTNLWLKVTFTTRPLTSYETLKFFHNKVITSRLKVWYNILNLHIRKSIGAIFFRWWLCLFIFRCYCRS